MERLCGFVGKFWPWSGQQAENHARTVPTAAIPQAQATSDRQPFEPKVTRPHGNSIPLTALGPFYGYAFEGIYKVTGHVDQYEKELVLEENNRGAYQSYIDSSLTKLSRLKADSRLDFTEDIENEQEEKSKNEKAKNDLTGDVIVSRHRVRSRKDILSKLWVDVYKHGQAYLNFCLDGDFDEPWCLDQQTCFQIRSLMDKSLLIQQRKTELRRLQNERFPLRHTPGDMRDSLDQRIAELEDTLDSAERSQDTLQRRTAMNLKDFLVRNGCINESQLSPHSTPQYTAAGTQTESYLQGSRENSLQREVDDNQDDEDDEEKINTRAIAEYDAARNNHELLQAQAHAKEKDLLSSQTLHLIAFPKSSIDRYRRLVAKWTASETQAAQEAEAKWMQARDVLIQRGLEVPQTPEPLDHRPTGGGVPDQDPIQGEEDGRKKLRKLNNHRAQTVHSADPKKRATPPRDGDVDGIGEVQTVRSLRSTSMSPGEAGRKKRRLEEYREGRGEEEWKTPSLE